VRITDDVPRPHARPPECAFDSRAYARDVPLISSPVGSPGQKQARLAVKAGIPSGTKESGAEWA